MGLHARWPVGDSWHLCHHLAVPAAESPRRLVSAFVPSADRHDASERRGRGLGSRWSCLSPAAGCTCEHADRSYLGTAVVPTFAGRERLECRSSSLAVRVEAGAIPWCWRRDGRLTDTVAGPPGRLPKPRNRSLGFRPSRGSPRRPDYRSWRLHGDVPIAAPHHVWCPGWSFSRVGMFKSAGRSEPRQSRPEHSHAGSVFPPSRAALNGGIGRPAGQLPASRSCHSAATVVRERG